ncbi:MAG: hypothetical protein ACFCBW_16770 [Candidatus Competibacterales bacterium]
MGVVALALVGGAHAASNDVILTWNNLALDTVRQERLGTPDAARLYALVNVAMYDAINGIRVAKGNSTRAEALVPFEIISTNGGNLVTAPADGNRVVAASKAALTILTQGGFTTSGELVNQFNQAMNAVLNAENGSKGVGSGNSWGQFVAEEVLALRGMRGSDLDIDFSQPWVVQDNEVTPFVVDGQELAFVNAFNSAKFRAQVPFAILNPSDYFGDGPPDPTSNAYAKALNDVKLFGRESATNNAFSDPENQAFDDIFRFWSGSGGTARPPGEWIKVAILVSQDPNFAKDLNATARLFALLGMAMADVVPVSWNDKFRFNYWRPRTAVNQADRDDNDKTDADPSWIQRNGSIGGSPEYTSGQSTFAGTATTVLGRFFGDNVYFTFTGDPCLDGSCPARSFISFSQAGREAGRARIFAGIHFQFSNEDGFKAGQGIGREVFANSLRPLLADDDQGEDQDDD